MVSTEGFANAATRSETLSTVAACPAKTGNGAAHSIIMVIKRIAILFRLFISLTDPHYLGFASATPSTLRTPIIQFEGFPFFFDVIFNFILFFTGTLKILVTQFCNTCNTTIVF
jgi:hypothetical protein